MLPPATIHSTVLASLNQTHAHNTPNLRTAQRHLIPRNTFPPGLQSVDDRQYTTNSLFQKSKLYDILVITLQTNHLFSCLCPCSCYYFIQRPFCFVNPTLHLSCQSRVAI